MRTGARFLARRRGAGEAWGGESDLGEEGEDFGGFGGWFGGGEDVGPLFVIDTPGVTPDTPLAPLLPRWPVVPIPEPSTWIMLVLGTLFLLVRKFA